MELALWIGVAMLVGLALGVGLTLLLRKAPEVQRLEQQIAEMQRRLDEWQRTTATQQQVGEVSHQLGAAQRALVALTENLRNLNEFTQQTLHRQATDQLQQTLTTLSRVNQALDGVAQSLSEHRLEDIGQQRSLEESLGQARTTLGEFKTALMELSETLRSNHQGVTGSLTEVQRILSAVQTLLQTAIDQTIRQINEGVGQLTAILLGRGSGEAGERLAAELLAMLPQDWVRHKVRIGDGEVEFALVMPGGYLVPIDSKFVGAELVAAFEAKNETARQDLERKLRERVQSRAREIAEKYLTDHQVLGFGVAAVPDSIYGASLRALPDAFRHKVVLVPYSLLVPFSLSLYLMAQRLGISTRLSDTEQAIGTATVALQQAIRELENMGREITSVSNQKDRALGYLRRAERSLSSLQGNEPALPETTGEQIPLK